MTVDTLQPGDPVSWFDARTLASTEHNLGVMAGRWIALFFVGDLSHPGPTRILADVITKLGHFFNDDHVIFYAVLTAPPPAPLAERFVQVSHRGLGFIADYDKKITQQFQSGQEPRLIVLDPMLRIQKMFTLEAMTVTSQEVCDYLMNLPLIDDFAGVPLTAPALIIPNVFEAEFCQELIDLHDRGGGKDSGFMLDSLGKTKTVIDHTLKQRRDLTLDEAGTREAIRQRVVHRVIPMIERFFQYRPTRMDRYLVSCYDAETGGHFARHRDNVNMGARHRRFAASFNLNDGYEGCGLVFPEFGRRVYTAPLGGAIVFSTGALHQVLPITKGKRYAFVPFFYGEEEARIRLENNAHLHEGEGLYTADRDKLFLS